MFNISQQALLKDGLLKTFGLTIDLGLDFATDF